MEVPVTPMVSVVVVTYQHAAYIERCVQGVSMQRADFPIELLIGEDGSTDGTREICQRLAAEGAGWIRLFLRSRADVINILGRPSGRSNLLRTLAKAKGTYVALCEGDDHWIDPHKLQRQVEAMELDPLASGCFTDAFNETNGERTGFLGTYTKQHHRPILTESDYMQGQGIPTCTFLFRRRHLEDYLAIIDQFATGDTALFTVLLGKGHFIYLPERTAVRVMHPGGTYSMQGALHHLRVALHNLPPQDRLSNGRYSGLLLERRSRWLRSAWNEALSHQDWATAREVWPHLRKDRKVMGWSIYRTWLNGLLVFRPDLVRRLVQLKEWLRDPLGRKA